MYEIYFLFGINIFSILRAEMYILPHSQICAFPLFVVKNILPVRKSEVSHSTRVFRFLTSQFRTVIYTICDSIWQNQASDTSPVQPFLSAAAV